MPLYEYECEACSQRFEVIQKFSDPHVEICRKCGKGPIRRLQSSPAFQFKGSGWYVTDYAQKGKSSSDSSPKAEKKDDKKESSATTETTTSETKSDKSDSAKAEPAPAKTPSTS